MMKILLIDDEPFYAKMIRPAVEKAGYEIDYARSGNEGLANASINNPDIFILDVRMPDMTGFEVIKRLRRDPRFKSSPVIFVSGQGELGDKLKAFELGADDYMEKPFQPEELVARLGILARRSQAMKIVETIEPNTAELSTVTAVHSLRGGVGTTSIAVNLALAYYQIWSKPTLLVDAVLTAGQVAMMLDAKSNITWEDLVEVMPDGLDDDMIDHVSCLDKSGIHYIASPKLPVPSDAFSVEFWQVVMDKFKRRHEFVVVDTAHDFSDVSIQMLEASDYVLLVLAPEMASLRAALGALDIYSKLGYTDEKIIIALNHNSNVVGIKQTQIEKVLGIPVDLVFPYRPNEVNRAINFGEPFLLKNPDSPFTIQLEDLAYSLSKDFHKDIPPVTPSASWKRVTTRNSGKR